MSAFIISLAIMVSAIMYNKQADTFIIVQKVAVMHTLYY